MKTLFVLIFSGLLVVTNVQATIINVPGDQPTIQAGIDSAAAGDTILVQPGRYVENILCQKSIVLGSLFLTTGEESYTSQTVIDGDSSGVVVEFYTGNDSLIVMNGFTITNGVSVIIP